MKIDTPPPRIVAIIPARMRSSRFPGKPLAPLLGIPLIEHVYRRTAMYASLHAVYVATCDAEIRNAVERFGGRVIMTSSTHQRASDRVAEAARQLDAEIVVMVQGDEPMTTPGMIDQAVVRILGDSQVQCVNLVKRIDREEEYRDPNTIKVVMDRQGRALYFSREPLPSPRLLGLNRIPCFKQVCIIPFRGEMLSIYAGLPTTPLEQAESIDMLRLLEHGYPVHLVETNVVTHAVDTRADLAIVEQLLHRDPLTRAYLPALPDGDGT